MVGHGCHGWSTQINFFYMDASLSHLCFRVDKKSCSELLSLFLLNENLDDQVPVPILIRDLKKTKTEFLVRLKSLLPPSYLESKDDFELESDLPDAIYEAIKNRDVEDISGIPCVDTALFTAAIKYGEEAFSQTRIPLLPFGSSDYSSTISLLRSNINVMLWPQVETSILKIMKCSSASKIWKSSKRDNVFTVDIIPSIKRCIGQGHVFIALITVLYPTYMDIPETYTV